MKIYCVFVISILFHEIGHIVMSKIYNVKFEKYKLGIFGLSIKNMKMFDLKKYKKIIIFMAGPMFNFGLAILFLFLNNNMQYEFVYTNLILGIFNLFPIIPLDGGNIMICLLEYRFDLNKSFRIALLISKCALIVISFLYGIFILVLKNIWIFILIIYLWKLYFEEEKNFSMYLKILSEFEKSVNKNNFENYCN